MKTFSIATSEFPIQEGCMGMPLKAFDKFFTETPHSSQNVSFAGILNRRKETASTPAPGLNKSNPPKYDPDRTTGLIGEDETSFAFFADAVFTKMPNPATRAPVIPLDLQAGIFASMPAKTEEEPPSVQALPNVRISSTSCNIWLEIPLQGATKPDNRVFTETGLPQGHGPAANNIPGEESAFPGKAAGPDQMLKKLLTSTSAMKEKMDVSIMNQAALQEKGPTNPGKAPDSKRTAEAGLEAESADEDRTARHHLTKDVLQHVESKFTDRASHLLLQKEGGPPPENFLSLVRRSLGSTRDENPSALFPKDAAPPATAHNPSTVINSEREHASKPVFLERGESAVELPDRAVTMKEGGATVTGQNTDPDKNIHLNPARLANHAEWEPFAFRAEALNTAPLSETKAPLSDNPAWSRTQAIIDQIIDAKQSMNGDFGRIRIVLSPPNLGTVDLEIVVRHARVEVVMTAENGSVQQALLSRADDIRNALQRHDLKIEAFQVFLQDQEANHQRQGHGGALFEQRRENQARHDFNDGNGPLFSSPIPAASFIQGSGPKKGRVSIFI